MLIACPYCGLREVGEFRYVDEVLARPDPPSVTLRRWRAYLYERDNPDGWTKELWFHRAGCRRYFSVERNTITNEVRP